MVWPGITAIFYHKKGEYRMTPRKTGPAIIRCPNCGYINKCYFVDTSINWEDDYNKLTDQGIGPNEAIEQIKRFTHLRQCTRCWKVFATVEVEESIMTEMETRLKAYESALEKIRNATTETAQALDSITNSENEEPQETDEAT